MDKTNAMQCKGVITANGDFLILSCLQPLICWFQSREHRNTLDPNNPRDVIDNYLLERGDDPALTERVFASTLLMLFPDAIDSACHLLGFIVLYLAHNPDWREVRDTDRLIGMLICVL